MKLNHEFIKLPFKFDSAQLIEEIQKFEETEWIPHPDKFKGNFSIPLLTVNGTINNAFNGAIKPTPALLNSPYLSQTIASFGEVFGRSRLMRLDPASEVPLHTDTSYHWMKRVRIHIPIVTDEDVIFYCGDKSVHMKAGEAWIFDAWKYHKVENNGKTNRVHLVIDTAGSSKFWQMVEESEKYCVSENWDELTCNNINYEAGKSVNILTEQYNSPLVMHPGEIRGLIYEVLDELSLVSSNSQSSINFVKKSLNMFAYEWQRLWSIFGENKQGWEFFNQLRQQVFNNIAAQKFDLKISNGSSLTDMLIYCVLQPSINVELAQ